MGVFKEQPGQEVDHRLEYKFSAHKINSYGGNQNNGADDGITGNYASYDWNQGIYQHE